MTLSALQTRRDLSGQILAGRYRVLAPVGMGAMGSVYRGEHVAMGRAVAIKVISEHLPGEMSARSRFEREARAMAKLEHPHCASVLDVGLHEDQPFVVMEFVDGQNLKELIDRGPLEIPRAVEITRQILSGLAHAHEHGIIHRDIKPANIVLSQKSGLGDHAKILDFGLAKMDRESSNLTTGVVVGTPSYMAPEQIQGQLLDHRVDIYACGVLLFELLTGTKPFRSANHEPLELCMMHLNQPPPRLCDASGGRDFGTLEDVVARALAKTREARFGTAGEFAAALVKAGQQRSSSQDLGTVATVALSPQTSATVALPSAAPSRVEAPAVVETAARARRAPSRRRWLLAAGGLTLGVAGAAVYGLRGRPPAAVTASAASPVVVDAPAAPPAEADPVAPLLARAAELARAGRRETAIDLLVKARKTYPTDARLPYRAGLLYLDRMWWADGLKQLRAAIAIDPVYRTDPELIKTVLRGFNTTARYDATLASFLRNDIGEAAKPYLEDTANAHPNVLVRKRAQAELRRY